MLFWAWKKKTILSVFLGTRFFVHNNFHLQLSVMLLFLQMIYKVQNSYTGTSEEIPQMLRFPWHSMCMCLSWVIYIEGKCRHYHFKIIFSGSALHCTLGVGSCPHFVCHCGGLVFCATENIENVLRKIVSANKLDRWKESATRKASVLNLNQTIQTFCASVISLDSIQVWSKCLGQFCYPDQFTHPFMLTRATDWIRFTHHMTIHLQYLDDLSALSQLILTSCCFWSRSFHLFVLNAAFVFFPCSEKTWLMLTVKLLGPLPYSCQPAFSGNRSTIR